jgi:putative nucleotide binding protein
MSKQYSTSFASMSVLSELRRLVSEMRNDRRGGQRRNQRSDKPDPLLKVEWCRVIDHPEAGGVVVVVTEPALHVIRLRAKPSAGLQMVGARLYMGIDHSKRDVIQDILGFARIRDLSNSASLELPFVIQQFIEDTPDIFLQQFFNRAGNLSLKMHAFELLAGVGNKKAMEMVASRGRAGWESFTQLNEDCTINAPELLAKRIVSEIEDRNLQPRLIDLLLRQDE